MVKRFCFLYVIKFIDNLQLSILTSNVSISYNSRTVLKVLMLNIYSFSVPAPPSTIFTIRLFDSYLLYTPSSFPTSINLT